jgi:hypothetical protein
VLLLSLQKTLSLQGQVYLLSNAILARVLTNYQPNLDKVALYLPNVQFSPLHQAHQPYDLCLKVLLEFTLVVLIRP